MSQSGQRQTAIIISKGGDIKRLILTGFDPSSNGLEQSRHRSPLLVGLERMSLLALTVAKLRCPSQDPQAEMY